MMQILVCGYTGRLGRRVAQALQQADVRPRLLIRPHHLTDDWSAPTGMTVYPGSYTPSPDLDEALAGVDAVFLVSPVHPGMNDRELAVARAAQRANPAVHIVKISGLATQLDSAVDSGRWHAAIERDIRSLGIHLTALQPCFFMQNLGFQLPAIRNGGVIRAGVDSARIAMIDEGDIADTAARVLLGGTTIEGRSTLLTGPQAMSYDDAADCFSRLLDRPVKYQTQTTAEVATALRKAGQPDWHIQIILQFNEAFKTGAGSQVTQTVQDVLNRPPHSLERCLADLVGTDDAGRGDNPFPS